MKRINEAVERQIPIRTTCAIKRQQLMVKRQLRKQRMIEQVQKLFESGYHVYVNKER